MHDLHVWQLTSGMNVASAHLVTGEASGGEVLKRAGATLRDDFGIAHATIQVEVPGVRCHGADW